MREVMARRWVGVCAPLALGLSPYATTSHKKSPPISINYPKHHTFSVQSNPHSSKPLVNDNLL